MVDLDLHMPRHIAIIMDGNGRWAKERNLSTYFGHNAGMKAMKKIIRESSNLGLEYLTVYAFSTENWKRTGDEIKGIFKLLIRYVAADLQEVCNENVKINVIGRWTDIPKDIIPFLERAIEKTKNNTGLEFNIALNYGSRDEITRAMKRAGELISEGEIGVEDVDEDLISDLLDTGSLKVPDPDLLIRTGGDMRLSNFLLWQMAYGEMVFFDKYWPDFTKEDLREAIEAFQSRDRRFGGRKR